MPPNVNQILKSLALALSLLICKSSLGQTMACTNQNSVTSRYFGITMHRFHDPKQVATILFGSWRLWDAGVSWRHLQPGKDTWDFRRMELALSIAEKKGVEVGLTLGATPLWAASRPLERAFMGEGAASVPDDLTSWDNYVKTIATRYKGRIHFYELWNEPASGGFYTGTVAQMVELARRAYKIIKDIDPAAIIVSPAPAKTSSLSWFAHFVRVGGLNYADVVGYHFYTDSKTPEDLIPLVNSVKEILAKQGISKPIWNTESGVVNDGTPDSGLQIGPAAHLARWLILGTCLGLERFHYYSWDHSKLGLFDPDRLMARPQSVAYSQVEKWLSGASMIECELNIGFSKCSFVRQGKRFSILWANSEITLGDIGNFKNAEDSFGTVSKNPILGLQLGANPILVW
jgi:hypothetical protein